MRVIWSERASEELDRITSCGKDNFGTNAIRKFYTKVKEKSKILESNPYIGTIEKAVRNRVYRYILANKHFKIIYRIDEQAELIVIVAIWDTHRDPDMLVL